MQTPWSTISLDEKFFKKQSAKLFWFIGLLAADGSIHKKGYTSLSQSGEVGIKIMNYVKELIGYDGKLHNNKNAHAINISNRLVSKTVEKYGVINNKTITHTPKNIPKRFFKSYLRGYFEGDGSVGVYDVGGSTNFIKASFVGTKEFVEYIKPLIPDNYRERKIKRCKNLIEIRYTGQYAYLFLRWLYSNKDLYFSYKYVIFSEWLKIDHDFIKFNKIKKKAKSLYDSGNNCMSIAKKLDVNFQLIYKWRKNGFKCF